MHWTQEYLPLGSMGPSALAAAAPLLLLFVLLALGKVKGWVAALASTLAAGLVATLVWRMPLAAALSSGLLGSAFALFPILWILFAALWIYHLCVGSGQFDLIRRMVAGLTGDRRLQALFIAFAFGAFLEGTAGFGVPVAITSAMLVGLGFPPELAATLCLLANSSPVAFAAAGVPIATAAQVSGLDPIAIGRAVGLQLPLLSMSVPLWLCVLLCGWRRSAEILPAILVAGFSLAGSQFLISSTLGPWTTGVLSGLAAMGSLALLLRFWKPRQIWDFGGATGGQVGARPGEGMPFSAALRAWSPYLLTSAFVLFWSTPWAKALFRPASLLVHWPALDGLAMRTSPVVHPDTPYAAVLDLSILASPGTAIFLAGILSMLILPGLGLRGALAALGRTLRDLRFTIPTVCFVLATAYLMNYSGMSSTIGLALSGTGALFPLFAPLLGWIGVLLTGSDTSSNALFCSLQATTARQLGLDPVLVVASNTSGGVAGKMISPQSLSVATAATGLTGREGQLFRSTFLHSLAMALVVGLVTLAMVYLF
ncbi:MAG TPA: lactate permease LctP family transporter [Rectinemataceae bacterium]|nr:lactate permease LctP family transporter [Rectinemataceae bacterium]